MWLVWFVLIVLFVWLVWLMIFLNKIICPQNFGAWPQRAVSYMCAGCGMASIIFFQVDFGFCASALSILFYASLDARFLYIVFVADTGARFLCVFFLGGGGDGVLSAPRGCVAYLIPVTVRPVPPCQPS